MRTRHTKMGQAHDAASVAARAGRGFTLLESLVAIGAVALVAVGLAAIFDSVGKTVTGGRRASRLTSFASIVEGQLRSDFDAMIRDKGVLVIRQNFVPTANGLRRADEVVFFARGDFKSVRPPIHPSRVPTSDTALIYYGHGARGDANYQAGIRNTYLYPSTGPYTPATGNAARTQAAPPILGQGENARASEWTLLRTATLLVKPQKDRNALENTQGIPDDLRLVLDQLSLTTSAQDVARIADRSTQFAMQPASPSIFRNVARAMVEDEGFAPRQNLIRKRQDEEGVPARSSGIVDIAMGDLDDVRAYIETGLARPGWGAQAVGDTPSLANRVVRSVTNPADYVLRPFGRFDLATIPAAGGNPPRPAAGNTGYDSIDRMHAWMSDLFPAQSDGNSMYNVVHNEPGGQSGERFARMRYETTAPGLLDVTDPTNTDIQTLIQGDPAMMNSLLGDQVSLGATGFLPRCTQFIVEWSFGQTYPRTDVAAGVREGEVIWHGPTRVTSSTTPTWTRLHATPYPYQDGNAGDPSQWVWHRVGYPLQRNTSELRYYEVSDRLIYGYDANDNSLAGSDNAWSLTSYFAYVDPTFDATWPQRPQAGRTRAWAPNAQGTLVQATTTGSDARDGNGDGSNANDPTDSARGTLAWAWPKMIRVTVTLADPRDKDVEETFQYVFGVPERGQ